MPCVKRSLLAFAFMALITFFPKVTLAATSGTCECFCGAPKTGAVSQGPLTSDACQSKCIDIAETTKGTQFVGCFADPKFYPDRNPKCWTNAECTLEGDWQGAGNMPYDCMKHKSSGDEMAYCYAPDSPYTLNVPIGAVTEISNLPTYVNTIYAWLLPAAALVAVVMMMIGGLQYVLSRGKSKYIEKAKTRITNAITGIVLLLSVFVILNLIDPRLTVLNSLKIPMIKEVTLLDAASSCERLDDYGYTITQVVAPASCGGTGQISGYDTDFPDNVLGSWEIGDKCEYMKCGTGMGCIANGDTKTCTQCFLNPNPSASSCAALSSTGKDLAVQQYCAYSADVGVTSLTSGPSCTTARGSLASTGFNCSEVITAAQERVGTGFKGCSAYEDFYFTFSEEQITSQRAGGTFLINTASGANLLQEICTDDFCGVAKEVGGTKCGYNTSAITRDVWGLSYGPTTTGYFCRTF